MDIKPLLSILAGLIFIASFFPYIKAILKGETQPVKTSWIIWATLDTIIMGGMITQNALNGQILGAVFGAWTVVVLAFKYGKAGWTILDKICLVGAVLGIALWQVFSSPTLGITTSSSVVFLGSIPTFVSAFNDPSREDRTAWTMLWVGCVVAVLAIPSWDLDNAAQPVTFFSVESIMMYLLWFRRKPSTVM